MIRVDSEKKIVRLLDSKKMIVNETIRGLIKKRKKVKSYYDHKTEFNGYVSHL